MASAPVAGDVGQRHPVGPARVVCGQLQRLDRHREPRFPEGLRDPPGPLCEKIPLASPVGDVVEKRPDLFRGGEPSPRLAPRGKGGRGGDRVHPEVVAGVVRADDRVEVGDAVQRAEVRNRFILRQGTSVGRALLATDGAAETALLFRAVRGADRRAGVAGGSVEHGAAEILRGGHPPLAHEVDERRGPVFGDPELPEDHGGGPEQAQDVRAGAVEPLPVGHRHGAIAVHGDGLEVLLSQDGAETAASDRVPLAHHDAGEEHPVFSGGADGGNASAVRQGAHRLSHALRPQAFGGQQLLPGGGDGEHDREGAFPLDEDREESRGTETPREPAPRGAVVHGPRQGRAGDDGEARGRRRRGPAQGADGEDDRHRRVERGKGVPLPEEAHAEAAPPEVRPEELRGDLLPPHPPGGEVDDENVLMQWIHLHTVLFHCMHLSSATGGDIPGSDPGGREGVSSHCRLTRTAPSTGRTAAATAGRGWRPAR